MKSRYIVIQEWMITELGLKGYELLVYALIFGFSQDGESRYHGSLSYMGKWLKTSDQTLLNALKSLYTKGLIERAEVFKGNQKFVEYWAKIDRSKNLSSTAQKTLAQTAQKTLDNNKHYKSSKYIVPQPEYTSPDEQESDEERAEALKRYYAKTMTE